MGAAARCCCGWRLATCRGSTTSALLDLRVLAFGAAATFATAAVCALWPVLVPPGRRLSVLAHGASVASDPRGRRIQRAVVVAQVATAVALLFGTTLFLRTVRGLDRDGPRIRSDGCWPSRSARRPRTSCAGTLHGEPDRAGRGAARRALGRGGARATVERARSAGTTSRCSPGSPPTDPSTWGLNPHLNFVAVSPRYFQTMGTRLVRGRLFTEADTTTAPGVAIVSETAARRLWPGQDPIGQRLREPTYRVGATDAPAGAWQTVVGVVQDVRFRGLNDVALDLYVPDEQSRNRAGNLLVASTVRRPQRRRGGPRRGQGDRSGLDRSARR